MRIWVEVELRSHDLDQYEVMNNNGLSFHEFSSIWTVGVKMSEEYYRHTIEYNFTPFIHSNNLMRDVTNFLGEEMDKHSLSLNCEWPAYVWTHIHIFEEDMLSLNKPRLLKVILSFIQDNMGDLSFDSKMRLLNGHQLWTYWSHNNDHKWINILHKYWLNPEFYDHNSNKKKYSPIISSRATRTGKPKSVEIRIVPNEFLFNWKLNQMLDEIKSGAIYERDKVDVDVFIKALCENLGMEKEEYYPFWNIPEIHFDDDIFEGEIENVSWPEWIYANEFNLSWTFNYSDVNLDETIYTILNRINRGEHKNFLEILHKMIREKETTSLKEDLMRREAEEYYNILVNPF